MGKNDTNATLLLHIIIITISYSPVIFRQDFLSKMAVINSESRGVCHLRTDQELSEPSRTGSVRCAWMVDVKFKRKEENPDWCGLVD